MYTGWVGIYWSPGLRGGIGLVTAMISFTGLWAGQDIIGNRRHPEALAPEGPSLRQGPDAGSGSSSTLLAIDCFEELFALAQFR
jgi:hypothetical protein